MSEKQHDLLNPRVRYLSIAGAWILLAIFWFSLYTPNPRTENETLKVIAPTRKHHIHRTPPSFEVSETFYATIIENNLFRPLGWTPPQPIEPYRLIGTILPRSANTPPKAIIETTTRNTIHIVTTGDKLDASTEVVSIEDKAVTLSTDGQPRTLHLPSGF